MTGCFLTAPCVLGILNTALEVAVISISSFAVGTTFSSNSGNFLLLIFQAITIKTLYCFIVLVLIRMIRPGDTENALPPNFLVFPILTMVSQFIFWYICACLNTAYAVQLLLSISSGCLFIATVLLFFIYSHQVKKNARPCKSKASSAGSKRSSPTIRFWSGKISS